MSSVSIARAPGRVTSRGWALVMVIMLASVISGAAIPRTTQKHSEFINWPPDFAPRAPALAERIAHDLGEYPRSMEFRGRDTMEVLLWNPSFWRDGVQSKQLPNESLPLVMRASKQVSHIVWTAFEHDGMNRIIIHLVRTRRQNYLVMTREIPAQDLLVTFTRQYYESRQQYDPGIGITQLEGGEWGPGR